MAYTQQSGIDSKSGRNGSRNSRHDLQASASNKRPEENSKPLALKLDLFSTSQTNRKIIGRKKPKNDRQIYDECFNNAPYFAYQIDGKKWGVVQGCCNDWNCPRCGQQRAREEYGRIVVGARKLGAANPLYMFTVTCRGREMTHEEAEDGYLVWTNKLLTRLRVQNKRAGKIWAYASVTERQERLHPHSHYLTTYCPLDAVLVKEGERKHSFIDGGDYVARHDTLQSETLERACFECGLGWQYDLSALQSVEGASRYVAKYLFKETIFTTKWPKGWRRVRYSQNWPKLPEVKSDAMLLLTNDDWHKLARLALIIKTKDEGAKALAKLKLSLADVIIQ